ncbi:MAG: cobalamin biosynthesis protein CobD [Ardenticatenia bacterium]|nr:MAG: cobalamin biosynthesis protein CobD [Ardenticatenia bacterium]
MVQENILMNVASVLPIALAWCIDLLLGDPPNRFHPVAYMGQVIALAKRFAPRNPGRGRLFYGGAVVAGGCIMSFWAGRFIVSALTRLPIPFRWLGEAVLLKMLFSLSGLLKAAHQIQQALERDDLDAARRLVRWHLVSRDTSRLSAAHVAAATIESIAENACDGVVAPLLYYALGGLPAALTYRFVSTCDSMWGYRDAEHEWLGKAAARLDDLLNLLPARLTALLIVLASWLLGEDASTAWCIWRRDAATTASPNAGHPMSAMAGALGVELEKIGHYRLGCGLRQPQTQDIHRAMRLTAVCCGLATLLVAILTGLLHRRPGDAR